MKNIKKLRSIGGIDDELIARAAPKGRARKGAAGSPWLRWIGPIAACLLIALAIFLPRALDDASSGGRRPGVADPGETGPADSYELFFNQAEGPTLGPTADRAMLPMMFNQQLTAVEIEAIFPDLSKSRSISAAAQFYYYDSSFYSIGADIFSPSGLTTRVQIFRDQAALDYILGYVLGIEAKTSDVLGTPVTAGYFLAPPDSEGFKDLILFADFQIDGICYYLQQSGDSTLENAMRQEFSELIGFLISGGAPDLSILSPSRPEGWRDDKLTLEEARADENLGKFIPAVIPGGFLFESATRFINSNENQLSVCWLKGMGTLRWRAGYLCQGDRARLTAADDTENFDLVLYPIPRADSVPEKLREIVENPIFIIEELTPQVVKMRAYMVEDSGDEPGERLRFSVLYDEVLVEVSAKGVPAEKIYEMLESIR